jgi:hypothetical protein
LLTTLLSEEKKWLAIIPEGFFATSSPTDAQSLSIVRGLDVYDISQMFQALYAPDLIRGQIELSELVAHIQTLAPRLSRELAGGKNLAAAQESPRSAGKLLANALLVPRLADRGLWRQEGYPATGYSQKPKLGSRGEDFPLVNRLQGLPAASAR